MADYRDFEKLSKGRLVAMLVEHHNGNLHLSTYRSMLVEIAKLRDELKEYKALAFVNTLTDKERVLLRTKLPVDSSLDALKKLVEL